MQKKQIKIKIRQPHTLAILINYFVSIICQSNTTLDYIFMAFYTSTKFQSKLTARRLVLCRSHSLFFLFTFLFLFLFCYQHVTNNRNAFHWTNTVRCVCVVFLPPKPVSGASLSFLSCSDCAFACLLLHLEVTLNNWFLFGL